ncbi:hypothetical protein ABXN37_14145 [Piscinibacter sakaiensis]|uniref:hypothetical protein n=1 Tax=Piscinibacter sakaiensis TaxID=1547922 RepID=UPI0006B426A6|nr:hypothetical protein [Piscinibacter sakaiensis]
MSTEGCATTSHRAEMALARLAGLAGLVTSVGWLLHSALRKEALLTSQVGRSRSAEGFIDDRAPALPPLVRMALVHGQFETVPPSSTATDASRTRLSSDDLGGSSIMDAMSAIRPITAARSGWRWRKPSA